MKAPRRVRSGPAGHTDDWLITYADTITLLLCLFVVMLSVQAGKPARLPVPSAPAVTQPMPQDAPVSLPTPPPAGWSAGRPGGSVERSRALFDFWDGKPPFPSTSSRDEVDDDLEEQPATAAGMADAAARTEAQAEAAADPPAIRSPEEGRAQAAEMAEDNAVPARPQPTARGTPPGDRITTLEFNSATLFDQGSATLSNAGQSILQDLVLRLTGVAYRSYLVTVEGHTDDMPMNTPQFPSNWELSTARAAAVVRFFAGHGVSTERLRAIGYADTHPLRPNRDAHGSPIPENQARNRRAVIRLERIERDATDLSADRAAARG